jgi:hypothetical protein
MEQRLATQKTYIIKFAAGQFRKAGAVFLKRFFFQKTLWGYRREVIAAFAIEVAVVGEVNIKAQQLSFF